MSGQELNISRVTRSKDEARATYDRISRWYDLLEGGFERRLIQQGLDRLQVQPGERVLEVGFGTGWAMVTLARQVGESGQVYGLDLSAGMLRVAQKRVDRAGLADRTQLRLGDAALLPYEAHSFDAVFMSFTLELMDTPDIPVVLGECRRVLREGGRLCAVSMSAKDRPGFVLRLYEWAHDRFPRYVDCRPIHVAQALRDAGFQLVGSEEKSMWRLPVTIAMGHS